MELIAHRAPLLGTRKGEENCPCTREGGDTAIPLLAQASGKEEGKMKATPPFPFPIHPRLIVANNNAGSTYNYVDRSLLQLGGVRRGVGCSVRLGEGRGGGRHCKIG